MKIDMSRKAVTLRLRQVAQLRRVCLALAKCSKSIEIQRDKSANNRVRRNLITLGR
jgi:hypothetical protein